MNDITHAFDTNIKEQYIHPKPQGVVEKLASFCGRKRNITH